MSDQNKSKSVDSKSGGFGGCGRTTNSNNLRFSWDCWAALIENEGNCIFMIILE